MSWGGNAVPQAWGQHGLRLGLQDAANYDALTDVIISCKGGVKIRSHRLVLASLSPMVRLALETDGMKEEDSVLVAPSVDAYELTNFLGGSLRGGADEAPIPESLEALCVSYQPASHHNRATGDDYQLVYDAEDQDYMSYEPNVNDTKEWLGGEDPLEMDYRTGKMRRRGRKKGSEVWQYFRKQGNGETVECLHCKKIFKNSGGGTSTMFRHLRKVHNYGNVSQNTIELEVSDDDDVWQPVTPKTQPPSVHISTVKPEPLEVSSEVISSLPPELAEKIDPEAVEAAASPTGTPRKSFRSNIWKFFEKIDNMSSCMDCGKEFKAESGTSTMGRHLKTKHPELYTNFEEMNEQDKAEKIKAKEEKRQAEEESEEEDEEGGEEGGEDGEGKTDQGEGEGGEGKENRPKKKKKKNKEKKIRSSVWKHFQRLKDDTACCNQCGKVFSIVSGTTTGLIRHLGRAHLDSYNEIINEIQVRKEKGPSGAKLTYDWTTGTFVPKKAKVEKTERKVRKDKIDHSDPATRTCPAPDCGKIYAHRRGMLVHYESAHSEHQPWQCNECGKTFQRKESWQRHNHDTARPFLCPTCGKTFKNRRVRDVHERSHRDDRRYPCSFCEKRFFTSAQKKVHERIHQGIKPYVCGVCNKAFVAKHQLTTHSYIHTGARPHKCAYCGRAFRHLSTKAKHNCPNKPAAPAPVGPAGSITVVTTTAAQADDDDEEEQQHHEVQEVHHGQWSTLAHEEIIYQQQVAQAVHSIQTIPEIKPPVKTKRRRRRF